MCAVEQVLCGVFVCFVEVNSMVRCVFASTSCKYDWREGDIFVLSWTRVQ